eukprot:scaffold37188_cov31-Tisochrysis_lutea.AAC.2
MAHDRDDRRAADEVLRHVLVLNHTPLRALALCGIIIRSSSIDLRAEAKSNGLSGVRIDRLGG